MCVSELRALLLLCCLLPVAAPDQLSPTVVPQRKALIVGINAYRPPRQLTNALNDAAALSELLKNLGFEVETHKDSGRKAIENAVEQFASTLRAGDVALFYYAGHGMQLKGMNYLLPVDLNYPISESEVRTQAVPFSRVKEALERTPARLKIMIFDACRNNSFGHNEQEEGLAAVKAGIGAYIVFSAGPGETASDNRREKNGLFAKHLLRGLDRPLTVSELFRSVRDAVFFDSGELQRPYIHENAVGDVYLRAPGPSVADARTARSTLSDAAEGDLYSAREHLRMGQCKEAHSILDALVRRAPASEVVRSALGAAYVCLGDLRAAAEQFSAAIERKPDYTAAYLHRGEVYLREGQYRAAIEDFNSALENEPDSAILLSRRGRAYLGLSEKALALKNFDEAITRNPESPYGYEGRGQVLFEYGRYREAEEAFTAALTRKGDFADAYLRRSRVRIELGNTAGARSDEENARKYGSRTFY